MQERNVQDDVTVDGVELTKEERQETEVWTRVMGYYRPVSFYNTGKQGEFHERVEFEEPRDMLANLEEAKRICEDDDADARDCPLYDENEPNRCGLGRILDEIEKSDGGDE